MAEGGVLGTLLVRDWLGEAGGCVLGGPWRLTEPCDVTIGGATWLDQAQETAARTNQYAGPHRRKAGQERTAPTECGSAQEEGGATESCANLGQGPYRRGGATDSCRSTQEGGGASCPPREEMSVHVQRGRGDANRGVGLQTGSAEAKRTAITSFGSFGNLVISISSTVTTFGAYLPSVPVMLMKYTFHDNANTLEAICA